MSVEEILFDAEERMEKALAKLKQDLTGIRTGRANPGMVDSLRVEAYGSPVPIKQIASVSVPDWAVSWKFFPLAAGAWSAQLPDTLGDCTAASIKAATRHTFMERLLPGAEGWTR